MKTVSNFYFSFSHSYDSVLEMLHVMIDERGGDPEVLTNLLFL